MSTPQSETGATPSPVEVSWSKDTDKEPGRDFTGTIVKAEYPFKDEKSQFEGEQIRFLVRADPEAHYENLQPIWLPPSSKKGTKFVIWRDFLAEHCPQAFREVLPAVQKEQSQVAQINAFCKTLVGMRFQFQDKYFDKPNKRKDDPQMRMLVPVKYFGRGEVKEVTEEKIQL